MVMPRRARLWSNTSTVLNVVSTGQPGQQRIDLSVNLESALGIAHLVGFTVVDTHVHLLVESDTDETSSVVIQAFAGIGPKGTLLDLGDFESLDTYDGDWLWYQFYQFKLPGAVSTLALPNQLPNAVTRSRASRRITDIGTEMDLIIQHNSNADVLYHFGIQQLWLMP